MDRTTGGLTAEPRTTRRSSRRILPLVVLVAGFGVGCSTARFPTDNQGNADPRTSSFTGVPVTSVHDEVPHDDSTHGAPDPAPETMTSLTPRIPAEEGAVAILDTMMMAWSKAAEGSDIEPLERIVIGSMRNRSRATASEFDAMRARFAVLLDRAGAARNISVVSGRGDEATWILDGTAYTVVDAGTEQWEIYLDLMPRDRSWSVWRPRYPVRLIRHPRGRGREIMIWPIDPVVVPNPDSNAVDNPGR